MAYGDYSGPDRADKGAEGGSCNRTRCQCSPANWYNHGSHCWYCEDCRRDIEFDRFNYRDWKADFQSRLGHPMFETRQMMDARAALAAADVPDYSNLLSIIADILEKSGVGAKPMLNELADAIGERVKLRANLPYLVQYRRKDGTAWTDMAAFDVMGVAERYRDKCGAGDGPWEYQVVEVEDRILSAINTEGE